MKDTNRWMTSAAILALGIAVITISLTNFQQGRRISDLEHDVTKLWFRYEALQTQVAAK